MTSITEAAEGTLPAGTWTTDQSHSRAEFEVEHAGISVFRGGFTPIDARLSVDDDGAVLEGSVGIASISIDDENIRPHLLSPEFFDADRTPEISFSSTRVEQSGDEVEIAGELTIKGTSLPIRARGTVGEQTEANGRQYFGLSLEADVDRTQYGLNWNNPLPNGKPALANDVSITAELYWTKD